ncbi:MAG: molybdate ABC transporter permease subunit [Candidatus Azotimanducaceae bacterium]|uniref:Molybdenum transport system permease n=1 Tax=OM182 bacterium TaxID=2510334 RepID=A0A520RWH4_9GAMM|nr:molybdate ABC transporter permease subunit [Gammaproteobacteria bacterium]RZO74600.1 MAG: molybdate ABC transporter permease subunit [OM182 bacterium]
MSFTEADAIALLVTLKLAFVSTLILLFVGTPLAWWLSRSKWRFKFLIEALVALPLVLPPTVLGFYLLIGLSPSGPIGSLSSSMGFGSLAFSFSGLVIGSVIYSMPFVVQPLQDGFRSVGVRPLEAAAVLRASPVDRFFTIAVPMAKPAFVTASVLGFAHTLGEFGVVLMIGGNIPGETQVVSIAIYDHVEMLDYAKAHFLSGILLLLSFLILTLVYRNRGFKVMTS